MSLLAGPSEMRRNDKLLAMCYNLDTESSAVYWKQVAQWENSGQMERLGKVDKAGEKEQEGQAEKVW